MGNCELSSVQSNDVALAILTCNAARYWEAFREGVQKQSVRPKQVLVIDSASTDGTLQLAACSGFEAHSISRASFDHGRTRQLAVDILWNVPVIVFLTQDAVLANQDSLRSLVAAFEDSSVGAAYGRQVPRPSATPIEAHARLFNYPAHSIVRNLDSRRTLGFKSIFLSNSFAAYRRDALLSVGGFPSSAIFGEDTIVTAKLHLAGWKTAYVAEAEVVHSHSYSAVEEMRRYFDIGVLHTHEAWLVREFGGTGGEGGRFVLSEMQFLRLNGPQHIPSALWRTFAKFLGYHLGKRERFLPLHIKRLFSMSKTYWTR